MTREDCELNIAALSELGDPCALEFSCGKISFRHGEVRWALWGKKKGGTWEIVDEVQTLTEGVKFHVPPGEWEDLKVMCTLPDDGMTLEMSIGGAG